MFISNFSLYFHLYSNFKAQSTQTVNKDDLGRISSGFTMFGGGKLEWEEEKYLQGAKIRSLGGEYFFSLFLVGEHFFFFCWQIKKFEGLVRKLGEGNVKFLQGLRLYSFLGRPHF